MRSLLWIAAVYTVMSIITFICYGSDKHQAKSGKRRISERTLHLLELFGGWPGAVIAQVVFRHKRRKFTYMLVFTGIVILHVGAWVGCYRLGWLP